MSVTRAKDDLIAFVAGIANNRGFFETDYVRLLELAESYAKEKRKARDNRDRWKAKKRGPGHDS